MEREGARAARWTDDVDTAPIPVVAAPTSARPRRAGAIVGRAVFGVLSSAVLTAAGFGWTTYTDIVSDTATADVLDQGAGGPKPLDGATDILLVGMDSRVVAQGNPLPKDLLAKLNAGVAGGETNTDTLILLRVPNDGTKAVGISIPRDSYVEVPGGFGKHKINSAFGRAKRVAMERLREQGLSDEAQVEVRSTQEGAQVLVRTVQELTGATVDHFAQVNLLGFHDITEAVGGVEVCLLNPVDDRLSGARFDQGVQSVSGASALAFVRQRQGMPRGDLDRIVRQQVFLRGMAAKALSTGILTDQSKLNSLLASLKKSIVLDQNWNLVDFARQAQGLSAGVEFQTIPTGTLVLRTPVDGLAVEVTPSEVRKFVRSLLKQDAPSGEPSSSPATGPENSSITVDVRNANGTRGVAGNVAATLAEHGFTIGQTTTGGLRPTSVVHYASGEKSYAEKVAGALGRSIALHQDANLDAGHVLVVLGKDFADGPPDGLMSSPLLRLQPSPPPSSPNGTPCVN